MRALFTGRRGIFTWTAIGVVVAVVAAITVVVLLPRDRTVEAQWGDSTFEVTAFGTDITVTDAPYQEEAAVALTSVVPTDYLALRPLEISTGGDIPDSGVTFELTLTRPLPDAAAVTFAYYDEEIAAWVPEYTVVSEDRRTLTAVVDHLSMWTVLTSSLEDAAAAIGGVVEDVGAGIAEAWDTGAQQLQRITHEILGNAAEYPVCADRAPFWVQEMIMNDNADIDLGLLGDGADGNAAVLVCAGSLEGNEDILEVRAAANRGYGFPVTMTDGVTPLAAGPSSIDDNITSVLQFATSYFVDAGSQALSPDGHALSPDRFVFATQEYTATFDEQTLRAASVGRIMSFDLPTVWEVFVSSAIKIALDQFDSDDEVIAGLLTAVSLIRDCELGDLGADRDAMKIVTWANACAAALDGEEIGEAMIDLSQQVDLSDQKLSAQVTAGLEKGGEIADNVAKKFKALIIFSIAQTVIDYVGDSLTEDVASLPAWYVQTILAPERPTVEQMYGRYTDHQDGGHFNTMKVDGLGIDLVACSGCGSVSMSVALVNPTWNGSCYDVVSQVRAEGDDALYEEQWMLCPKGMGGPGDDSVDRIGQRWMGKAPSTWYLRD